MKVLVVEDNAVDRKLHGAVLATSGHDVVETDSAESAVEAITKHDYDVILLDLRLPGMDGLTLVRKLKGNADTRGIPVVAVTAFTDQFSRLDLLAAGCDSCIVKPIDTRQLAAAVEGAAEKKFR